MGHATADLLYRYNDFAARCADIFHSNGRCRVEVYSPRDQRWYGKQTSNVSTAEAWCRWLRRRGVAGIHVRIRRFAPDIRGGSPAQSEGHTHARP